MHVHKYVHCTYTCDHNITAIYVHTFILIMVFSLYRATAKHDAHTAAAREHQQYNDNDDGNIFFYIQRKHYNTLVLLF